MWTNLMVFYLRHNTPCVLHTADKYGGTCANRVRYVKRYIILIWFLVDIDGQDTTTSTPMPTSKPGKFCLILCSMRWKINRNPDLIFLDKLQLHSTTIELHQANEGDDPLGRSCHSCVPCLPIFSASLFQSLLAQLLVCIPVSAFARLPLITAPFGFALNDTFIRFSFM